MTLAGQVEARALPDTTADAALRGDEAASRIT